MILHEQSVVLPSVNQLEFILSFLSVQSLQHFSFLRMQFLFLLVFDENSK